MSIEAARRSAPLYPCSRALFDRAQQVMPGGIHLSGRPLLDPDTTPMYFERGAGCRLWDADGREYVDYLMAFGAVFIGYAQREVDDAAHARTQFGHLLSLNHRLHVQFIEALLPRFPGSEMGIFFRTGSEATTAALRVARRATGRRRVVRCGYHGWHDWCLPLEPFVPDGLAGQVLEFDANRPTSLAEHFSAYPGQIAAVILAPEMVMPHRAEPFVEIRRLTQAHGAVLVMDEVKTGLRFAPNSISERVGIRPDMITLSKTLANGYPAAALLGSREVMQAGAGMHYSATFHGDTAAMAAAHACMALIEQGNVQAHVHRLGALLIEGLNASAQELGLPAQAYGEPLPAMPFFRFTDPSPERNAALTRAFFQAVLAGGVLFHPRHMWFLSASHTESDVAFTLDVARRAMQEARKVLA